MDRRPQGAEEAVLTMDEKTENEIPPDIRIAMAACPAMREYEAWRVVVYSRSGSFYFRGNNSGLDWKTRRNAQNEADRFNKYWRKNDGEIAVVRRFRITERELPDEDAAGA